VEEGEVLGSVAMTGGVTSAFHDLDVEAAERRLKERGKIATEEEERELPYWPLSTYRYVYR